MSVSNQMLPVNDTSPGFFGPSYDIADQIPTPAALGVKRGSSLSDSVNAMKGMAYYVDTIGFGQSSTNFSRGLKRGVESYGVNYLMPTGARCSNGADMWMYVETIPKGDSLGVNAQKAMKEMGMPELRGLAPGIVEDAKSALNPKPIFDAVFGSGYPKCVLVEKRVGDPRGKVKDDKGNPWIYDISSVYMKNGIPYQQKWMQETDKNGEPMTLTREQYLADKKLFNSDGSPIQPATRKNPVKEVNGFCDGPLPSTSATWVSLAVAVGLTLLAIRIRH